MAAQSTRLAGHFNLLSSASLVALIALCIAWELWLAPLRAGGSLLVLKAFPLMLAMMGVVRGKRYTHQWASLLSLLYLAEGTVRATSDTGSSVPLAWLEVVLSLAFFIGTVGYARVTRPSVAQNELTAGDSSVRFPDASDSGR